MRNDINPFFIPHNHHRGAGPFVVRYQLRLPAMSGFFIPLEYIQSSFWNSSFDCPLCWAFFIPPNPDTTITWVNEENRLPAMSGFFHSTCNTRIDHPWYNKVRIYCPLCWAFFIPLMRNQRYFWLCENSIESIARYVGLFSFHFNRISAYRFFVTYSFYLYKKNKGIIFRPSLGTIFTSPNNQAFSFRFSNNLTSNDFYSCFYIIVKIQRYF